jgi:lipoprotein Spr
MVKSQPILRYILRIVPALALATLLSACSSTHSSQNANNENHEVNNQNGFLLQASQDEFEEMVRNVDVKSRIMEQYAVWKGVRYRLGGDTKRGIDCSLYNAPSAISLAWNYPAPPLSSRTPAERLPAVNCVRAIW